MYRLCVIVLFGYQTTDNVGTTDSNPVTQLEGSQDSEAKATSPPVFSDESSESLVSIRSDENISNKGSPVKKGIATYAVSSSEPLEASTEEVCKYVVCACIH